MGERLKGKAAVVTGSGRGLGRAFAMALAAEGASVVVNDIDDAEAGNVHNPADGVAEEVKRAGGRVAVSHDSVVTAECGQRIIDTCVNSFGRIDILVNNAGILSDRMIFNMTPEQWDEVIKVHLYGTFNCTRAASALMKAQRSGRIINITSPTALGGLAGQANYGAAKAGILGFTRVVARDLGKYGITVNAFSPTAATRMTLSADFGHAAGGGRPPGAVMSPPEDNAPVVVFLASDAAAGINGQTIGFRAGQISLYTPNPTIVKTIDKEGRWTFEELLEKIPAEFGPLMVNPTPPENAGSA